MIIREEILQPAPRPVPNNIPQKSMLLYKMQEVWQHPNEYHQKVLSGGMDHGRNGMPQMRATDIF